jgi:hypothetical protein
MRPHSSPTVLTSREFAFICMNPLPAYRGTLTRGHRCDNGTVFSVTLPGGNRQPGYSDAEPPVLVSTIPRLQQRPRIGAVRQWPE